MDAWIKVIEAVTSLLSTILWPAVALYVIMRLAPRIFSLVEAGRNVTLKGFGVEASFTNSVTAATAALTAAEAKRAAEAASPQAGEVVGAPDSDGPKAAGRPVPPSPPTQPVPPKQVPAAPPSPEAVAGTVTRLVPDAQTHQNLQGTTLLWVDDHPDNNRFEREAFQALGIQVELSTSTQDALDVLNRRHFDAVISDLRRGLKGEAGYELLAELRRSDSTTPFFIYAASDSQPQREEARSRGAQGRTSSPRELLDLVIPAIRHHRTQ